MAYAIDEKCKEKLNDLKKYLPTLQAAIDKYMESRKEEDHQTRLEKLNGLYEIIVRPEQHRISMPLLIKAEDLLRHIATPKANNGKMYKPSPQEIIENSRRRLIANLNPSAPKRAVPRNSEENKDANENVDIDDNAMIRELIENNARSFPNVSQMNSDLVTNMVLKNMAGEEHNKSADINNSRLDAEHNEQFNKKTERIVDKSRKRIDENLEKLFGDYSKAKPQHPWNNYHKGAHARPVHYEKTDIPQTRVSDAIGHKPKTVSERLTSPISVDTPGTISRLQVPKPKESLPKDIFAETENGSQLNAFPPADQPHSNVTLDNNEVVDMDVEKMNCFRYNDDVPPPPAPPQFLMNNQMYSNNFLPHRSGFVSNQMDDPHQHWNQNQRWNTKNAYGSQRQPLLNNPPRPLLNNPPQSLLHNHSRHPNANHVRNLLEIPTGNPLYSRRPDKVQQAWPEISHQGAGGQHYRGRASTRPEISHQGAGDQHNRGRAPTRPEISHQGAEDQHNRGRASTRPEISHQSAGGQHYRGRASTRPEISHQGAGDQHNRGRAPTRPEISHQGAEDQHNRGRASTRPEISHQGAEDQHNRGRASTGPEISHQGPRDQHNRGRASTGPEVSHQGAEDQYNRGRASTGPEISHQGARDQHNRGRASTGPEISHQGAEDQHNRGRTSTGPEISHQGARDQHNRGPASTRPYDPRSNVVTIGSPKFPANSNETQNNKDLMEMKLKLKTEKEKRDLQKKMESSKSVDAETTSATAAVIPPPLASSNVKHYGMLEIPPGGGVNNFRIPKKVKFDNQDNNNSTDKRLSMVQKKTPECNKDETLKHDAQVLPKSKSDKLQNKNTKEYPETREVTLEKYAAAREKFLRKKNLIKLPNELEAREVRLPAPVKDKLKERRKSCEEKKLVNAEKRDSLKHAEHVEKGKKDSEKPKELRKDQRARAERKSRNLEKDDEKNSTETSDLNEQTAEETKAKLRKKSTECRDHAVEESKTKSRKKSTESKSSELHGRAVKESKTKLQRKSTECRDHAVEESKTKLRKKSTESKSSEVHDHAVEESKTKLRKKSTEGKSSELHDHAVEEPKTKLRRESTECRGHAVEESKTKLRKKSTENKSSELHDHAVKESKTKLRRKSTECRDQAVEESKTKLRMKSAESKSSELHEPTVEEAKAKLQNKSTESKPSELLDHVVKESKTKLRRKSIESKSSELHEQTVEVAKTKHRRKSCEVKEKASRKEVTKNNDGCKSVDKKEHIKLIIKNNCVVSTEEFAVSSATSEENLEPVEADLHSKPTNDDPESTTEIPEISNSEAADAIPANDNSQEAEPAVIAAALPVQQESANALVAIAKPSGEKTESLPIPEAAENLQLVPYFKLPDDPIEYVKELLKKKDMRQTIEKLLQNNESAEVSQAEVTDLVSNPEPAQVLEPEPVVVSNPEPVQVLESEPVVVSNPEPAQVPEPQPVVVSNPEQVEVPEPEPVVVSKPRVIAKKPSKFVRVRKKPLTELEKLNQDIEQNIAGVMEIRSQRSCRTVAAPDGKNGPDLKMYNLKVVVEKLGGKNVARRGQRSSDLTREHCSPAVGLDATLEHCSPAVGLDATLEHCSPAVGLDETLEHCLPAIGLDETLEHCSSAVSLDQILQHCSSAVSFDQMLQHCYTPNGEQSIQCLLCGEPFDKTEITLHYKRQHPESEVLISRLPSSVVMKAIDYTAVGELSFVCHFCGFVLPPSSDAESLFLHATKHTGEYKWRCGYSNCLLTAALKEDIIAHAATEHTNQKIDVIELYQLPTGQRPPIKGHLCSKCNYVQIHKHNIEKHLKKSDHKESLDIILFGHGRPSVYTVHERTLEDESLVVVRPQVAKKSTSGRPPTRKRLHPATPPPPTKTPCIERLPAEHKNRQLQNDADESDDDIIILDEPTNNQLNKVSGNGWCASLTTHEVPSGESNACSTKEPRGVEKLLTRTATIPYQPREEKIEHQENLDNDFPLKIYFMGTLKDALIITGGDKSEEIAKEMLTEAKLRDFYKCMGATCSFTTQNSQEFVFHLEDHENDKLRVGVKSWNKCAYCHKTPYKLVTHLQNVHRFCRYQCSKCFYRATEPAHLKSHLYTKHENEIAHYYECSEGKIPKTSRCNILKLYKCMCKKTFREAGKFIDHWNSQHYREDCQCNECEEVPQNIFHLVEHYRQHGFDSFHCAHCSFAAKDSETVGHHLAENHAEKQYWIIPRSTKSTSPKTVNMIRDVAIYSSEIAQQAQTPKTVRDDMSSLKRKIHDTTDFLLEIDNTKRLKLDPAIQNQLSNPLALKERNEPRVASSAPKAPSSAPEQSESENRLVVYKPLAETSRPVVPIRKTESRVAEGIFGPHDIDALPPGQIFAKDIQCALCEFKNKVKMNVVRHLGYHLTQENVPPCAPTNPVPCLDNQELMFNKMSNLADSSQVNRNASTEPTEEDLKCIPPKIDSITRYLCNTCFLMFADVNLLVHHINSDHPQDNNSCSETYCCQYCPEEVPADVRIMSLDADAIFSHMTYHDAKMYKCPYCMHFQPNKKLVERHVYEAHPLLKQFVHTIRESNMVNIYQCSECTFSCAMYSSVIVKHLKTNHNRDGKYKCRDCDYIFKKPGEIKKHSRECHSGSKPEYICLYTVSSEPREAHKVPAPSNNVRLPENAIHVPFEPLKSNEPRVRNILIETPVKKRGRKVQKFRCNVDDCKFTTPDETKFRYHLHHEYKKYTWFCGSCNEELVESQLSEHVSHSLTEYDRSKVPLFIESTIKQQLKLIRKKVGKKTK